MNSEAALVIIEEDGQRILCAQGVLVALIEPPDVISAQTPSYDPFTDVHVLRAIQAMLRLKRHELDVMALAFDPSIPAPSADVVRRLAESDVAAVRNQAASALERGLAFINEFHARGCEGVENLRRFAKKHGSDKGRR